LHRQVEELFDDWAQAVDLVDEENVSFSEIRKRSNKVTGLLECGPGRRADVDAELARDELGKSGLAEAGWAEEERVVERLTALECGVDVDAQRFLDPLLADEFGQALRTERELNYALVGDDFRGGDFGSRHRFGKLVAKCIAYSTIMMLSPPGMLGGSSHAKG